MAKKKVTSKVVKQAKQTDVKPVVKTVDTDPVIKAVDVKPVVKETVKERVLKNQKQFDKIYFENSECDYKAFGDWQINYGTMLDVLFNIKNKHVLDAGGAFGALGHAMSLQGAKVTVLDISKHVIDAKLFPNIKYQLAPVQSMKKMADDSVDFLHASFVLNHVDTQDIERTLKEFKRVMKKDAISFILMNCDKDGYTVKEMSKYIENVGLTDITKEYDKAIKSLPKQLNYFKEYKWNVFILKK